MKPSSQPLLQISSSSSNDRQDDDNEKKWTELVPGAWCVEDLFTDEECEKLMSIAKGRGIESKEFKGDIRYRQRVTEQLQVPELSRVLWERIKDIIPQEIVIDESTNYLGYFVDAPNCIGTWKPSGVHKNINVVYCSGKGHLAAHTDGYLVLSEHERSFLTINGYLTARPIGSGGATRFLKDDIYLDKKGAIIKVDDDKDVLCRVEQGG